MRLTDVDDSTFGIKQVDNKPRVSSTPYFVDIAEGNVTGHYALKKFGENEAIGTSFETVWAYSTLMSYSSEAETMYLMSSDAGDDQDYTVYGLDGDWAEQSASVTCNGRTPVAITGTWLRITRVVNAGTTDNAGNVYVSNDGTNVTDGVPDTAADVRAMIPIGTNQTLQAAWSVPAGYTFYLTDWWASESSNKGVDLHLAVRPFGGVFLVKQTMRLNQGQFWHASRFPLVVAAKSDIEVRAKGAAVDALVTAGFDGWYEA